MVRNVEKATPREMVEFLLEEYVVDQSGLRGDIRAWMEEVDLEGQ